jgi:hypothetical protein
VLRLVGNGVADGSPGCKPSPGYGWAGSRLRVGTGLVPHRTYINLCITVFLSYEQYVHTPYKPYNDYSALVKGS